MALKLIDKITDRQLNTYGVVAAPTVLTGTPAENKAIFDRLIRHIIAPTMNDIVDNENEIVKNEDVRQDHEADRDTAEQGRVEAEKGRVQAEAERVLAEDARNHEEARRVQAEIERKAVSANIINKVNEIVNSAETAIQSHVEWAQEEADRASERAESAYQSMCSAEDACGWAEDAQEAAELARDEAVEAARQAAQSEAVVTGAITSAEVNAETAGQYAAQVSRDKEDTQKIHAAIHLRKYIRTGTATDAELLMPGDELVVSDGSSLGHVTDYQDLIWEAQMAAAGETNDLASMAVLSVINATNWRRTADGLLWTTDTLDAFCAKLVAFAAAAVAAGYVADGGRCIATWAQAQAWLLEDTLLSPVEAEARDYPWRMATPRTEMAAMKEWLASVQTQLGYAADRMDTLIGGGALK